MIRHTDVLVVGAGPAGLLAALRAAETGARVILAEKNKETGKKLRIAGKGRCNVTNTGNVQSFVRQYGRQGKFLHSAFGRFFNEDLRRLLDEAGVPTKEERGGRVFPVSDRAGDVADALESLAVKAGAELATGCRVQGLIIDGDTVQGVRLYDPWDSSEIRAKAVIVTTGGASYPLTGSTGDGYTWAQAAGHSIVPLRPALVPLESPDTWVRERSGLALRNVKAGLWRAEGEGAPMKMAELQGELMFAHFGLTGPIILSLSRHYDSNDGAVYHISIDMKPALSDDVLDKRLIRDFEKHHRKQLAGALVDLLPRALIEPVIAQAELSPDTRVSEITREQRKRLLDTLKALRVKINGARPMEEAIVTAGGVSLSEVEPGTLASRLVKGLYFAGEVLDIDGLTGGYNLQAAFSTGYLAGASAAGYAMTGRED